MKKHSITPLEFDNALRLANFATEKAEALIKAANFDKPEGDNPKAKAYFEFMRECARKDAEALSRFARELLKQQATWGASHTNEFIAQNKF